jgi:hypothetical protein
VNKAAEFLSATPLGGIANTIAGGLNTIQGIVQKGRCYMQNLQPILENDDGGGEV